MTVFTGVVDGIPAFQYFPGIFFLGRLEGLGCGVMQTMSQRDPGLAILIDQCLNLFGLELDALLVPLSWPRNMTAGDLQEI